MPQAYFEQDLFFLFFFVRFDAVIIKQPSSFSFDKKVIKSCKILENKESPLSIPPHEFEKMLVVQWD